MRLLLVCLAIVAGSKLPASVTSPGRLVTSSGLREEPITPVPSVEGLDAAKVAIGRQLFQDVRLSRSQTVSCASCHQLDGGGADDRARSPDPNGQPLDFNTPTVFNAALNPRLDWRGNFRTLEEQNEAVLLDPRLMNMRWPELLERLTGDPDYRRAFASVYGSAPDRAHVLNALATFQRSLLTPDARFDRYLRGETKAITEDEERGYRLFKGYGCIACHQGANVGGNLFQKFGVFQKPFAHRTRATPSDLGRFTLTGQESDRFVFRVPSLRNVTVTGPYFHDGSVDALSEAVTIMARSQLGRELSAEDNALIVKFLETLTGVYQGRRLSAPHNGPAR